MCNAELPLVPVSYLDFKNVSYLDLNKFFLSFNWNDTFSQYNANGSATMFNDFILHCIDLFVPLKTNKTSSFPR